MPTFIYKARDDAGKSVKGTMEAVSRDETAQKLRKMGYAPTHIEAAALADFKLDGFGDRFRRIKAHDLIIFNIQLSNMIGAGLTIVSALRSLERQIENRKLRTVVGEVRRSIEGGATFSDALAKYPQTFSKLFIDTVRAGEASGKLHLVLSRLAVYEEKQDELRQKIKNALFYPAILVCAGIVVVVLITSFVMPQFVKIFTEAGVRLPLPTQILYKGGLVFTSYWYVVFLFFSFLFLGIKMYAGTPRGRFQLDRMKLDLPVTGPLIRKVVLSRFSRTLATLVESGVPILQSLEIIRDVVGNQVIGRVVQNVRDSVEKGGAITEILKVSGEFPEDIIQMVGVGEETGKLAALLSKIADFYDTAVDYSVKRLTALIEPAFLVVLGTLVGFIMASMLLPMFDMVKTIH